VQGEKEELKYQAFGCVGNCYQLKTDSCNSKMFYVSLIITIKKNSYTKDKVKRIKAYHHKSPLNHKGKRQERKKRTKEL
jgi:hypothetical protein